MAKTKKPTGLTIKREGVNFILGWSKGDKDYGADRRSSISWTAMASRTSGSRIRPRVSERT